MTENEEERERTSMDVDEGRPDDPLLRREEDAAAREAGGHRRRASPITRTRKTSS